MYLDVIICRYVFERSKCLSRLQYNIQQLINKIFSEMFWNFRFCAFSHEFHVINCLDLR